MLRRGSNATLTYFFRHPDPALPASKNRYAIAFYSYSPEIVFGETLLVPQWTQLSQEEIRQNGGVLPPPQPLPTDTHVRVKFSKNLFINRRFFD